MEQMGGFEDERVCIGNQMQMELASMHDEQIGDFIEKHAEDFRNIIVARPELIDAFKRDPGQVLSDISKEIYH